MKNDATDYGAREIHWLRGSDGKPLLNATGLRRGMVGGEVVDEVPTDSRANSRPRIQKAEPTTVHTLYARGILGDKEGDEAKKRLAGAVTFQGKFDRANLGGKYASLDIEVGPLGLTGGGSDPVTRARDEVAAALESLPKICRDITWYVIGCDNKIDDAVWRLKGRPGGIQNRHHAVGVLLCAMDGLRDFYRI